MNQYKFEDYIYPEEINWCEIFDDLEKNDIRPCHITELIGITGSSLQKNRQGSEPRYSVGKAILTLHSRYCTT